MRSTPDIACIVAAWPPGVEPSSCMQDPSYPRDLVGHGRMPPHPRWPGGARIAVQSVVSHEEVAEPSILHGDTEFGGLPVRLPEGGAAPGRRHMSMERLHDIAMSA